MIVAFLLAAPLADRGFGHLGYLTLVDSTVTILRAKSGQETVSVPGYSSPAASAQSGASGAAKNASEFCPPPYRMTERDGCQPRGH
jgi:hypothetical protein